MLSADYRVEIPPALRRAFGAHPGQPVTIELRDGHLEIAPVNAPASLRPIQQCRGLLRGMDTEFERDGDRV